MEKEDIYKINKQLKILISAYACEPDKGSEPGVGWNWVTSISSDHEIWVITRANNKEIIEQKLNNSVELNIKWLYYDLPPTLVAWKKWMGVHVYYYLWQICVYLKFRRILQNESFDVIHHLTFGIYWMPSFLHFLNTPFVWGPVGGREDAPKKFIEGFSLKAKIFEKLRYLSRFIFEHGISLRLTIRRSKVVLCKAQETRDRILELKGNAKIFSEAAMSQEDLDKFPKRTKVKEGFQVISIGRLVNWKGFDMGIEAFKLLNLEFPDSKYIICGDGPEKGNYLNLIRKLNLEEAVTLTGHIPRNEILDMLMESSVLVHPSLHDSGGWACLEGLAASIPVICLDIGGPAIQINSKVGVKIEPHSRKYVVEKICENLRMFYTNRGLVNSIGSNGRKHVEENFNWSTKAKSINEMYNSVLIETNNENPTST